MTKYQIIVSRCFLILSCLAGSVSNCFSQDLEEIDFHLDQFAELEYVDIKVAKAHLDTAELLLSNTNHLILKGRLALYKGWYFQDVSHFEDSRAHFFQALEFFTQANAYNDIADAYGNLGNAFLDVGDLKSSLDYQLKSLEINEKILRLSDDPEALEQAEKGRAYAWSNISNIYKELNEYEKALSYEFKGLNYEIEKDDSVGIGISYVGLGSIYGHLNMMDSALYYSELARLIFLSTNYSSGLINADINLYNLYEKSGDLRIELLTEAYQEAFELGDKYAQTFVMTRMIQSDFEFSDDSLVNMINRSKQLIEEYEMDFSLAMYYKAESKYLARKGQFKKAYESIINYLKYFEAEKAAEKEVDFESAEIRYEFQQKSFHDSLAYQEKLHVQKIEKEKKIRNQQYIIVTVIFCVIVLFIFLIFLFRSVKLKSANNKRLSEKNELIERQKAIVESKNKEITDSINYAERLQNAILPELGILEKEFDSSFVFYRPKDVVSGDFYWIEKEGEKIYLAVADCTGHGVPGAMVSVVCKNALDRAVFEFNRKNAGEILDKTRELVVETFDHNDSQVRDGMDCALCIINKKEMWVEFSGAYNPLWLYRWNERSQEFELKDHKGDKQPIGRYEENKPFTSAKFEIKKGDYIVLFSDGYADQFGGESGKKLKYKGFEKVVRASLNQKDDEKLKFLTESFDQWIGEYEQLDDICVIGVRI